METRISDIGQIAITVNDVGISLEYYRDVLGLQFLFQAGPNLAFLSAGGIRIMLSTPQGYGTPGKNSILFFKVKDIEKTHEAIVQRGSKSERGPELVAKMPDHELWISHLLDPDGNLVSLMEERNLQ